MAAALLSSCAAKRTLTITSDPAGAEVRIDDVIVGQTPLVLPFFHYGTRQVTFYLEGYLTESFDVDVEPPWYARFPMDFVTEIFVPVGWSDNHRVHADMRGGDELRTMPALQSVLERAEVLRRAGPMGPRTLPESELEDRVGTPESVGVDAPAVGASSQP
ncbi:MAG: PEGA domain-containing protein [Planctomycetota bacterium]